MDRSSEDIDLNRKIFGAIITIWGLLGLGVLSYEVALILEGITQNFTLARFTLNTGIIFGGLGILMNQYMGYVVTIFLVACKIAIDIASENFIMLVIDLSLFLGVISIYMSQK